MSSLSLVENTSAGIEHAVDASQAVIGTGEGADAAGFAYSGGLASGAVTRNNTAGLASGEVRVNLQACWNLFQ